MSGANSRGKDGPEVSEIAQERLARLRGEAIAALSRGASPSTTARSLGVSVRTVQRWVRKLKEAGTVALQTPVWPGKSARLMPELLAQLAEDLKRVPQALGYAQIHWTAPLLSRHIRGRFGLRVGDRQCLRLLRQVGLPRGGDRSNRFANIRAKEVSSGAIEPPSPRCTRRLTDRQLKNRALSRIRRLASSGLPLVPFASTLFDLTSEAVPQAEGIRGICADVHRQSWFFRGLDYVKWEPAIRKYAMEDNPAESGIVPQAGRNPAITTALSFEQMVFPHFHDLPGYHELYRYLNAHHFIGALLGQGDALGIYTLWRDEAMKPFTSEDLHFHSVAATHVAHAVKTARLIATHWSSGNDFETLADGALGVVLMSFKGRVLALNREAKRLFHQLGVFDGSRDASSGVPQALEHIARTMRTIFEPLRDSAETTAPAMRIYRHWSGITLSMRGFATEGDLDQERFVVLIEQGELGQQRRKRIMHRYGLSSREAELLPLLGSGLPIRDIAERMRIGRGTIKTYSSRLAEKLELPTLKALRAFAIERGI